MKKLAAIILILAALPLIAEVKVKVRDIATIDGIKANQVLGYGIVVGLAGSGDSKLPVTNDSLRNVLKYLDIDDGKDLKSKNIAAVMVTANLPGIVRVGDRVDLNVSSIGDAKSIEGGTLIQSQLRGADGQVYVAGQGSVSIPAQSAGRRTRPVKTAGTITQGGIVERAIDVEFIQNNQFSLVINEPDFAVVDELAKAVAGEYPDSKPVIGQNGKITFTMPAKTAPYEFIAKILEMEVTPKFAAKVVINEKDGTIVMGADVKISEALVSKDGLTVKVEGQNQKVTAALFKESSTVKDLVDAMNYLNVSTTDLIAILRALKDAGALHAELVVK